MATMPLVGNAQSYQFEKLYETAGQTGLQEPVLSTTGTVSFIDGLLSELAIYVHDRQVLSVQERLDADLVHIFQGADLLDIDSSGRIAFLGEETIDQEPISCTRIFLSSGANLSLIERVCDRGVLHISILDSGQIIYASPSGPGSSIITNDGQERSVVFDSLAGYWLLPLANEAGTIVAKDMLSDRIVSRRSDGTTMDVASPQAGLCDSRPHSINDSDVVLFSARDCDTDLNSIYAYDAGQVTLLVSDLESGTNINFVDEAHVNNRGKIVFSASQLDGTYGIFEIDGGTIAPILITGQSIDGREISGMGLSRHPFNDDGDVVFRVHSFDAATASHIFMIYVASIAAPIVENPGAFAGSGGGSTGLIMLLILLSGVWRRVHIAAQKL